MESIIVAKGEELRDMLGDEIAKTFNGLLVNLTEKVRLIEEESYLTKEVFNVDDIAKYMGKTRRSVQDMIRNHNREEEAKGVREEDRLFINRCGAWRVRRDRFVEAYAKGEI